MEQQNEKKKEMKMVDGNDKKRGGKNKGSGI